MLLFKAEVKHNFPFQLVNKQRKCKATHGVEAQENLIS